MRPAVLYVTYDGVLEPLGESQVVNYLEGLAPSCAITLLSFEKPADRADASRMAAMRARLDTAGIAWIALAYHKRPPVLSTARDVFAGIRHGRRVVRAGATIVHARGYVPSLIALGVRGSRAKFLFDMRGFWVDEKVEAGHWPRGGWLARVGKFWERRFFAAADGIVSLTAAGVRAFSELGVTMRPGVPVDVIPTCADLTRFSGGPKDTALAAELGLAGRRVIGCAGTMENWYLRREMLAGLAAIVASAPDWHALIVTRDDHDRLRADLSAAGVPAARVTLTRASFAEMPRYLRLCDAALFFITPTFSKRGSAATKLAEFLGCGVPVVINDGVGDSGTLVRDARVGVVLSALDAASIAAMPRALETVLADAAVADRCRCTAEAHFDLATGVEKYRALYQRLLEPAAP